MPSLVFWIWPISLIALWLTERHDRRVADREERVREADAQREARINEVFRSAGIRQLARTLPGDDPLWLDFDRAECRSMGVQW